MGDFLILVKIPKEQVGQCRFTEVCRSFYNHSLCPVDVVYIVSYQNNFLSFIKVSPVNVIVKFFEAATSLKKKKGKKVRIICLEVRLVTQKKYRLILPVVYTNSMQLDTTDVHVPT